MSHLFVVNDSIIFPRINDKDSFTIRKILSIYEKVYGQKINLAKSIITFSRNVSVNTRKAIKGALGLDDLITHDSYLGLLYVVGKNKKKFANI